MVEGLGAPRPCGSNYHVPVSERELQRAFSIADDCSVQTDANLPWGGTNDSQAAASSDLEFAPSHQLSTPQIGFNTQKPAGTRDISRLTSVRQMARRRLPMLIQNHIGAPSRQAVSGENKMPDNDAHERERTFHIQIDRAAFVVAKERITGLELRRIPSPPIGADRDLFEVVPGGSDKKIENEAVVELRNGLRFFTAPAQINPGQDICRAAYRR